MSDTLEKADVLPEAWLEQSVPCLACQNPAQVRAVTHRCAVDPGPRFRCLKCFSEWVERISDRLAKSNSVKCNECLEVFYTVVDFSDYREF